MNRYLPKLLKGTRYFVLLSLFTNLFFSSMVALAAGAETVNIFVCNDQNANGACDVGEPGIAGAGFTVMSGVNPSAVTDNGDGSYVSNVDAGSVSVGINHAMVATSLGVPLASLVLPPVNPQMVTVIAGTPMSVTFAYGINSTPQVQGHLFMDDNGDLVLDATDNNGVQDAGEMDLANINVDIMDTASSVTLEGLVSDASGNFTSTVPLSNGQQISVDIYDTDYPAGATVSTTGTGGTDPQVVTMGAGLLTLAPIGFYAPLNLGPGKIRGWVYFDGNSNGGANEPSDVNLGGVTVNLTDPNNPAINTSFVTLSANTGNPGYYEFDNLPPSSTYQISIDQAQMEANGVFGAGSTVTTMVNALPNNPQTVTVAGQLTTAPEMGFNWALAGGTGSVQGWVYYDGNANGQAYEPSDLFLANVTVTLVSLSDPSIVIAPVKTASAGAQGHYIFNNVPAGQNYQVAIDVAQSIADGAFSAGASLTTGNDPQALTVVANQTTNINNVGYTWTATSGIGNIHGFVFFDGNGNGIPNEAQDVSLAGVIVNLLDTSNNLLATYKTEQSANGGTLGHFVFNGLPSGVPYIIQVDTVQTAANGVFSPSAMLTTNNDPQTINNVVAGQNMYMLPIGYTWSVNLTGHLFMDNNGDGIQDANDPDLDNVDVIVSDMNGNSQTVATDANGNYSAAVGAGTYTLDVDTSDPDIITNTAVTTNASGGTDPQTVVVSGADVAAIPVGFAVNVDHGSGGGTRNTGGGDVGFQGGGTTPDDRCDPNVTDCTPDNGDTDNGDNGCSRTDVNCDPAQGDDRCDPNVTDCTPDNGDTDNGDNGCSRTDVNCDPAQGDDNTPYEGGGAVDPNAEATEGGVLPATGGNAPFLPMIVGMILLAGASHLYRKDLVKFLVTKIK